MQKKDDNIRLVFKYKSFSIEVLGPIISELSKNKITNEVIESKVSELGDTPFIAKSINVIYDGTSFIPFSELKKLKRTATDLLKEKILDSYRKEPVVVNFKTYPKENVKKKYILSALVSTKEQEKACIDFGITKIYHSGFDISKEMNLNKKRN